MAKDQPAILTDRIREEANRLGFFGIGITPARPLPESERLDSWLRQRMHGEMFYLERQAEKRKNPSQVFPEARSIISLAMNYNCGDAHRSFGKISRYAWGKDYHVFLKKKLTEMLDSIRRLEPSAEGLTYVDTGPVMEKVWGAESSLGWMGKHTNLITRAQGSWFFIGVILVNLRLEYDARERDFCGKCTRCIAACPTGAIVAPYVLDARLCISYLTIELRGPIPRSLRPLIGDWIFGCDECQNVCPWNRFAVNTDVAEFRAAEGNSSPPLSAMVDLTAEQFRARFADSPIRRTGRDGFLRNVVVALGNSKSPEAIPALGKALRDPSSLVRSHAAWALGQIECRESVGLLEQAPRRETDAAVLEEIGAARATCGTTKIE